MTRLATMGTSSCATLAIAGFKADSKQLNEAFINTPQAYSEPSEGMNVSEFYNNIIYPTSQPLGHTKEYPFEKLMKDLEKHTLGTKFTIVTLNQAQYTMDDSYWPKQLEKWGFELVDKTNNAIGSMCYIFTRNNNRPK